MEDVIVVVFVDNTWVELPFLGTPNQFDMKAFVNMIKVEGGVITPGSFIPGPQIKMIFRKGAVQPPQHPGQNAPTTDKPQ